MSEFCPLGNGEVWDAAIPDECLRCWLLQQNPQYSFISASLPAADEAQIGARYQMEHGIQRSKRLGRRVITELMVYTWDEIGEFSGHVVRRSQSEVDCLREV